MAARLASLVTVSTLPSSPPRLLLPRRPAGTFCLSTSTFLSSFQTLRAPSEITRHLHRRHPLPGELAVVRAGPPSASTLILVFVLPLSLLIGTILVSIRIGNKLDEKFLEELAANQAMVEENEDAGAEEGQEGLEAREGEEDRVMVKEEIGAAAVRVRNRPKREV
ncbi:hypothetical protein M5K25_007154 [Dendrobium thyrsiflorum]|uniref:High chlorophyll fluorescence 153 n=1 Tax=Dendrobium thyrsiflorum TaxID=117978 RepID=A0ABD0VDE1_DENTH